MIRVQSACIASGRHYICLMGPCLLHVRLEQAMEILRRRKPMFMDKPIAASLAEVLAIYTVADAHRVPVFSSSSLRWLPGCVRAKEGNVPGGTVVGANITSPCPFETQFRPEPDLYHCMFAHHTHVLQHVRARQRYYTQSHARAYETKLCLYVFMQMECME